MNKGYIMLNGVLYSGGGGSSEDHIFVTQEEYDALPEAKLTDDKIYFVEEDGAEVPAFTEAAENVFYRGIEGQPDNVQSMLELLSTKVVDGFIDALLSRSLEAVKAGLNPVIITVKCFYRKTSA